MNNNIKATIFGLTYSQCVNSAELLKQIHSQNNFVNISICFRIKQKQVCQGQLFLSLVKFSEHTFRFFDITNVLLVSEQENLTSVLKKDPYPIVRDFRFNLCNVPMCGAGDYAIVLTTKKNDLDSLLDAYYFNCL